MNLLQETIETLEANGKTLEDIYYLSLNDFSIEKGIHFFWKDFLKLSDIIYDAGYGTEIINSTLKLIGKDWWLERREYDGAEWWVFCTFPKMMAKKLYLMPRQIQRYEAGNLEIPELISAYINSFLKKEKGGQKIPLQKIKY